MSVPEPRESPDGGRDLRERPNGPVCPPWWRRYPEFAQMVALCALMVAVLIYAIIA